MRIDFPTPAQIPELRRLWMEAFGDAEAFLDSFFGTAFSPTRCRCVCTDGELAAALYWLDMTCRGQSMAYLYAVATKTGFRGRGLCRSLMADTHLILKQQGYAGAILSPDGEALARMYEAMGYRHCSGISEFSCTAAESAAVLRRVDAADYQARRNALLPPGSVQLADTALAFLAAQTEFYVGEDFALAASRHGNGNLFCPELLGNTNAAQEILTALGCTCGTFRVPGNGRPFAMFHALRENTEAPVHLGFAFD